MQSVSGATHRYGHTLDLLLSYGISVCNVEVYDPVFSDHCPILFDVPLPCDIVNSCMPARRCRVINSFTAAQFSAAFENSELVTDISSFDDDVETFFQRFEATCKSVLDSVAPLKSRRPKPKTEPWLNESTRAMRRECRRAERRWKRDRLQVSL